MSRIPHKKSRPITVADRKFRWMLQGRSRFLGNTSEVFHLTIQEDVEKPGGVIQTWLHSKQLDGGVEIDDINPTHKATVFPSDIELIIKTALAEGWDPNLCVVHELSRDLDLRQYRTSAGKKRSMRLV